VRERTTTNDREQVYKALARIFLPTLRQMALEGGEIRTRRQRSSVRATFGALFRFGTTLTWDLGFDGICVSYPIFRMKSRYFHTF
jgi:hypothetical protein